MAEMGSFGNKRLFETKKLIGGNIKTFGKRKKRGNFNIANSPFIINGFDGRHRQIRFLSYFGKRSPFTILSNIVSNGAYN